MGDKQSMTTNFFGSMLYLYFLSNVVTFGVLLVVISASEEFQSANDYPYKSLQDPVLIPHEFQANPMNYELKTSAKDGTKLYLSTGTHTLAIDPNKLEYMKPVAMSSQNENVCPNTLGIGYLCEPLGYCNLKGSIQSSNNNQYCGLTATINGCPIRYRGQIRELKQRDLKSSRTRVDRPNDTKCKETVPILMSTNKIYEREALPLVCKTVFSNTLPYFKRLSHIRSVVDRKGHETIYGLFFNNNTYSTNVGLCSFSPSDIRRKFEDLNLDVIAYNKKSEDYEVFKKRDLTDEHVLAIHGKNQTSKTEYAMINFHFDKTKNITHYTVTTYEGIDNVNYGLHYFATNNGEIIKGITDGRGVNVTIQLYKEISGTILQMEISDKSLIVLTSENLYKLPLSTCDKYGSCQECVGLRDPQCLWDEKSCVETQDMHKNGPFVQSVKFGQIDLCIKELQTIPNKKIMDAIVAVYNLTTDINTSLNEQNKTLAYFLDKINSMNETIHQLANEINNTNRINKTNTCNITQPNSDHSLTFFNYLSIGFVVTLSMVVYNLLLDYHVSELRQYVYKIYKMRYRKKDTTGYKLSSDANDENTYTRTPNEEQALIKIELKFSEILNDFQAFRDLRKL